MLRFKTEQFVLLLINIYIRRINAIHRRSSMHARYYFLHLGFLKCKKYNPKQLSHAITKSDKLQYSSLLFLKKSKR